MKGQQDLTREIIAANREFYNEYALEYEQFQWYFRNEFEQRMWWREVKFICRHLSGEPRVLDIGCGTGNLALKFLHLGCQVIGVDISQNILRVLASKVPSASRARIQLINTELDEFIDNSDDTFDVVAECSTLHHLPYYNDFIDRITPLVKPGGFIYITQEPVHKNELAPSNTLSKITHKVIDGSQDCVIGIGSRLGLYRKTKAPDHTLAAYHYFKEGVSQQPMLQSCEKNNISVIFNRRYNRRRMTLFSYIDNVLLGRLRLDRFQYTWFSMLLQRSKSHEHNSLS